jgi:hypothetical protein
MESQFVVFRIDRRADAGLHARRRIVRPKRALSGQIGNKFNVIIGRIERPAAA